MHWRSDLDVGWLPVDLTATLPILARLDSVREPEVDRAVAAALPTATPEDAAALANWLLDRAQPSGLAGLIRYYHRLNKSLQSRLVRHIDVLYRPLREVATRGTALARGNAVEIIRRSRATPLAYLLAEELRHGSPENEALLRAAAEALEELARWASSEPDPDAPPDVVFDAAAGSYLQSAIEEAMICHGQHREPAAVTALLNLAPRPITRLSKALADPHHPAVRALRHAFQQAQETRARPARAALLAWITTPSLTASVLTGLHRVVAAGGLGDVLDTGHLLVAPKVAAAVSQGQPATDLLPTVEALKTMAPHRQRHVARWITALALSAAARVKALASLHVLPDGPARLSALRALMRLADHLHDRPEDCAAAVRGIERYCDDPDPRLARMALRDLIRRRTGDLTPLLLRLSGSVHGEVRQLAQDLLAPVGFDRFWQAWPRLTQPQRIAAGRALIKIDPRFHVHLGARLAEPRQQIQALSIIRTLNQGQWFQLPLITLSREPDSRVASAAVTALAHTDSPPATAAVHAALSHQDARVRANAVEALYPADAVAHRRHLRLMSENDANRPRANALASLIQMQDPEALQRLEQMLRDPRPPHRVSALWVVEQATPAELARLVAEMAVSDPDPDVRHRAIRAVRKVIEAMTQQKQEPPRNPTPEPAPPATPIAMPPTAMALILPLLALTAGRAGDPENPNDPAWMIRQWRWWDGDHQLVSPTWLLVAFGSLLATMAVYRVMVWQQQRRLLSGPMVLFHQVASEMGLDLRAQWLLVRIAQQQDLPSPLTLLTSRGTLEYHAIGYIATLTPDQQRRIQQRVAVIRDRVFRPLPASS